MNRASGYLFSSFTAFILLTGTTANNAATEITVVPSGNRYTAQPPVPNVSAKRIRALSTTYDANTAKSMPLYKRIRACAGRLL